MKPAESGNIFIYSQREYILGYIIVVYSKVSGPSKITSQLSLKIIGSLYSGDISGHIAVVRTL